MRATLKIEGVRLLVKVRPLASTAKYPDSLKLKGEEKISRTKVTNFLGGFYVHGTVHRKI